MFKYMPEDQLKRFDSYKYCAVDTSPLSKYVMHPFWNKVVEFVPMSTAPNTLTLAGFGFTLLNAVLLSSYDYSFYAASDTHPEHPPIPNWVWFVCAINLFLAHTLDGIDGKHARRTKATGPLGELMDHGVDSWTAVFIPLSVYSLFGRADFSFSPFRVLFVFWSVFLTFYITHWEKYNTGILYLPWSYDLSQLFLLITFITTSMKSYKFWKFTMPFLNIPFIEGFELLLYVSILLTLPLPLNNVYSTFKSGKTKYSSSIETLKPLVPLLLLFITSVLWAGFSKSDILSQDPRLYFYTLGTIFSNISCRLIICQMSSTKFGVYNGFLALFSLVALTALILPPINHLELMLLRIVACIVTLGHIHFAIGIVRQMCDHLGINAFSLEKRKSESSRQHLLNNKSEHDLPLLLDKKTISHKSEKDN